VWNRGRVAHTHHVTFSGDEVRKRFVSWDRGEPNREWAGLTTLARHVPDLAPTPLAFEVEDDAPVVVMSRLSGEPLGEAALTTAQTQALAFRFGGCLRFRSTRRSPSGPTVRR
jgi:hypothetical protein